jgi:hypothetical protein
VDLFSAVALVLIVILIVATSQYLRWRRRRHVQEAAHELSVRPRENAADPAHELRSVGDRSPVYQERGFVFGPRSKATDDLPVDNWHGRRVN